mmetsp:Transcript_56040/g.150921  ORF Transcript_56040/g.150921 Transcript_56040/m.150921 type:complete len:291 (-) Transcript_56040:92-964(-)
MLNLPQASCQKPPTLHMVISAGALGKMESLKAKAPRNKHCNLAPSHEDARLQQPDFAQPREERKEHSAAALLGGLLAAQRLLLGRLLQCSGILAGCGSSRRKGRCRLNHGGRSRDARHRIHLCLRQAAALRELRECLSRHVEGWRRGVLHHGCCTVLDQALVDRVAELIDKGHRIALFVDVLRAHVHGVALLVDVGHRLLCAHVHGIALLVDVGHGIALLVDIGHRLLLLLLLRIHHGLRLRVHHGLRLQVRHGLGLHVAHVLWLQVSHGGHGWCIHNRSRGETGSGRSR